MGGVLQWGHRPVWPRSLAGEAKRSISPISDATGERVDPAEPGPGDQQRDVAMIGALAAQLDGQACDLQLERVDQLQAGVDSTPPRVGDREAIEQLTAGEAEQITDRARVSERDQRR